MFLGIPHIEPPIGDLRFRKPLEYKRKWNSVLETKEFKPACMSDSKRTYFNSEGGAVSEDCLYVNVFTNHFCLEHKNCSVMVVVHGGQMIRGSTVNYHSDVITNNFVGQERNIIVVAVPYRLGILGLPNLPGNLEGIADRNLIFYDVLESLKWVKREIRNFGGDSNKTTLFGHSGGASIVAMMGLIPESEHLYQKSIIMSGPWLMQSKNSMTKMFLKVAQQAGCYNSHHNQEIFECMRRIPAETLQKTQDHVFRYEEEAIADFSIDGKLFHENPRKILKSGNFPKKPLLIGTLPFENRFTQYFMRKDGKFRDEEILKMCELFGFAGAYERPYEFVEKCVEFYMDNATYQFLVDDYVFHVPTINLARHHASEHPVYLYSYKYSGLGAGFSDFTGSEDVPSPVHSEDFVYLFGVHRTVNFTHRDLQIEQIFTGMIADFVNFGEPKGQDWHQLNPEIMNYFEIDFGEELEMPGMKYEFYKKQEEFWNEMAPKAGGEFSYNEVSSKSFDVFPLREFGESKNTLLGTKFWEADKTVEIAKKSIIELEEYIAMKKKGAFVD